MGTPLLAPRVCHQTIIKPSFGAAQHGTYKPFHIIDLSNLPALSFLP
jgi:hypothetical protein